MAASHHGPDVIWSTIKWHHAYLRKQKQSRGSPAYLSSEPFNLNNVHSRGGSGFTQEKAATVNFRKPGLTLSIQTSINKKRVSKRTGKLRKTPFGNYETQLGNKGDIRAKYAVIRKNFRLFGIRPQQQDLVLARASAIFRSQLPPKAKKPEKKSRKEILALRKAAAKK
eukprot:TRINITY_DN145_c0_g1_i1.p1 TRINITY_DN145_c0_g1~~TRINITY_DN145_c0_g1_i1.p1  ORF type:complete len:168 (-),score=43.74 TRINITY_DN145_c0_g1_i1:127-630(-)